MHMRPCSSPDRHACQILTFKCFLVSCCSTQPPDQLLTGRFYYKDGATYEGQYKLIGLVPAAAEPAKKAAKKKEDEAAAQPAEPPKPVRHGVGVLHRGWLGAAAGQSRTVAVAVMLTSAVTELCIR